MRCCKTWLAASHAMFSHDWQDWRVPYVPGIVRAVPLRTSSGSWQRIHPGTEAVTCHESQNLVHHCSSSNSTKQLWHHWCCFQPSVEDIKPPQTVSTCPEEQWPASEKIPMLAGLWPWPECDCSSVTPGTSGHQRVWELRAQPHQGADTAVPMLVPSPASWKS